MKASYYWLAVALGVAVAAGPAAAADPAPGVLLLDDFRIVEGTVEKFDKLYRVTAGGKPQLVNEFQVLHRAATRAEVYKYMADRADLDSVAGRTALAAWYAKVGEPDRALAEARAAAALAPAVPEVRNLVTRYEQEAAKARAAAKAAPEPARLPPTPPLVLPAAAVPAPARPPAAPVRPPTVATETAAAFGTRAQPILMNLCASCHAHKSYGGVFKLDRVPEGYVNAAATTANLGVVVAQLSKDDPAASPLLVYAVTAHGGAKRPPLPGPAHPAYQNLEQWVFTATGPLRPAPAVAASAMSSPPSAEPAKLPVLKSVPLSLPDQTSPSQPVVPAVGTGPQPGANSPRPTAPIANPDDPFDPDVFNRLPKKK